MSELRAALGLGLLLVAAGLALVFGCRLSDCRTAGLATIAAGAGSGVWLLVRAFQMRQQNVALEKEVAFWRGLLPGTTRTAQ